MEKEIRIIPSADSEVRILADSRHIEGHGIVVNSTSRDMGGWREIILPEAINGLIESSDVLALVNHSVEKGVLARSKNGLGSLSLSVDVKGLSYSFEAPNTNLGNELIEGIKRGDISTSSFAFSIKNQKRDAPIEKQPDGTWLRTIKKFDSIHDVSMVYHEAYENTDVALRELRSIEEFKEKTEEEAGIEIKPAAVVPVPEPIIEVKVEKEVKEVEPKKVNNLKTNKMATIKELQDQRAKAIEDNEKIAEVTKVEKRAYTEAEQETAKANNQKMSELDLQIETEKRKLGTERFQGVYIQASKKEEFSLLKTLRAAAENRPMSMAAQEVNELGAYQLRKSGQTPQGGITIPFVDAPWKYETRADILAQTATQGKEIVAEDKKAILPPLLDRMVLGQAGATYMTGLVGDVSIPSYAGTTVAWKDEVEAAADGGGAFKEVYFAPKRLTGYINVSKTFLAQDGVGAERMLLSNIADAVAHKLEATILGIATLSSKMPSGIGYKLNVANGGGVAVLTGATVTYPAVVGLETTIDVLNASTGNLAYIMNSTARGLLKIKDLGTSNDVGDFVITKENTMNGYPVLVTNAMPHTYGAGGDGNAIIFGNWKDLCIAQWGGYDITVDPYTAAKTNQIVIVINAYFDAKGLRGSTGTGTTLDEYATSFAALSIK